MDVFPFFTGCQRSGTTLIREIFRAHSRLAIPRESHFIPELARRRARYESAGGFAVEPFVDDLLTQERFRRWKLPEDDVRGALVEPDAPGDFPDAIRRLYALFAGRRGKPQYADKTPRYALEIPLLSGLFPEARFVHVIRDGRDVALSLLEVPWGPTTIEGGAWYWRERVTSAREAGRALGSTRYLEYRHEDLVEDPRKVVQTICTFLDLPFEDAMLRYHERRKPSALPHGRHLSKPPTKGLRDWRSSMGKADLRTFELISGDLLEEIGYERVTQAGTLDEQDEKEARVRARRAARKQRLKRVSAAGPLRQPAQGARALKSSIRRLRQALGADRH